MGDFGKQTGMRWALLGLGILLSGCASYYSRDGQYAFQEVYYLTTRGETASTDPNERFNGDRGEVNYGMAMVAIDENKSFSTFAEAQPNRTLKQSELLQTRAVQQVRPFSKGEFMESIVPHPASENTAPEVLIFIHGYRKAFARTVTNAAQLRHELAFPGSVIAFSWPSRNTVSGYMSDVENLNWSQPQLRKLIESISQNHPDVRIHILAHSLGNRALVKALKELLRAHKTGSAWNIGEIVFMAPDLDRAHFIEHLAGELEDIPSRMTLYVSSRDFPLMTAAQVYQYPRLGDAREGPPVLKGIETIDVSDAISVTTGHGYYEANKETIEDLYYLIHEGKGAAERPTLTEAESDDGTYWRLKPED